MSGRKQHYLPQFLQRPFSHREKKDTFYVHVHEKHKDFSPSTAGIGAIRDFYSDTNDTQADDNITAAESILGSTINQIILKKELPAIELTAQLFSALSVRTLKMRTAITKLAPILIASIRSKSNENGWPLDALKEQFTDKNKIDAAINNEIRKFGNIDRNKRAILKHQTRAKIKREYEQNRSKWLIQFRTMVNVLLSDLETRAATIADDAFLKVFADPDGLVKRDQSFTKFDYTLIKDPSQNFLLGDCAVTALDASGKPRLALGDIDEDIVLSYIFLPISPGLAIQGTRNMGDAPPATLAKINEYSVALSNHYFISFHETSTEITRLKSLIGSALSPIVALEEILEFLK